MKRKILFSALLLILAVLFCSCTKTQPPKTDGPNTDVTEQENTKVYVKNITLDDSRYSLEFNKEKNEYKITLPDGRPAVPRVSAEADGGVDVKINQAAIPDGQTGGKATVVATDKEGNKATYTVEFTKDRAQGFVLQYDDRFVFTPTESGEYTFESSDPSSASVDEKGEITAKKLSDTPITITAKIGGEAKETLKIDRIEKAHINLFFITGQSNGQGCYDSSNYNKEGVEYLIKYEDQLAQVEKIEKQGTVYSYDVHPIAMNKEVSAVKGVMYDMSKFTKQGHQASLGKTFYELSGEKVVFLQSAWSGAPIESWLDPKRHPEESGLYSGNNFYLTTKAGYTKLMKKLEKNYEVVYVANFWCQGETAMTSVYDKKLGDYIFSSNPNFDKTKLMTDDTYYKYFMMLHNDMKEDFGLQYNGIMMTKTKGASSDTAIVPIVSAHFALCNNNSDIHIATRKFIEIATTYKKGDKSGEGYGYLGTDNNHYNQIGYNYHGKEAGTNAFNAIFGEATNKIEKIEIISTNGKDRIDSSKALTVKLGKEVRIAAICVPNYINENLVWTSDNEGVATVDEFGVITGVKVGSARITVEAESGEKATVFVNVTN